MISSSTIDTRKYGLKDISVVIPVLNDVPHLKTVLGQLSSYPELEVIVVNSSRNDASTELVKGIVLVTTAQKGRGTQFALGIEKSTRPWIWLLHADCTIDAEDVTHLETAINTCNWGRFDARIGNSRWIYRCIETLMNLRSRVTGICTGDQGIFLKRDLLTRIGGFPNQMLMEDIELSKRLCRVERPYRVRAYLNTSARKWENQGVLCTVLQMWRFRLRYFFGESATSLYRDYYVEK